MKHTYVVSILVGVIMAGCATKHVVEPVNGNTSKSKGVFYSLPRTVVVVSVPVIKTTTQRSHLWDSQTDTNALHKAIARIGLRPESLYSSPEDSTAFQIAEPSITSSFEADPEAVFFIQLKGGFLKNRNFNLRLSEDGIISSAESKIEDKSLEFGLVSLESVAKIAGAVLKGAGLVQPTSATNWFDTIIESIKTVRDERLQMHLGKLPPNLHPETFKRMLEELDAYEAALISHLTGVKEKQTRRFVFEIRPPTTNHIDGLRYKLLELFKRDGIKVFTNEGVTTPIDNPFESNGSGGEELWVSFQGRDEATSFSGVNMPTSGERSYSYRRPLPTVVTLQGKRGYARTTIGIAQFGTILSLPSGINSSSSVFKPVFYPASGAIQELTIQGNALSPNAASPLVSAATSLGGAIDDAKKERKMETDELEQLKRQVQLLDQMNKIKDLQKSLSK